MEVRDRLRRLDDRLVPGVEPGRYDQPRPWWVFYGAMLSVPLVFVAIYAMSIASGGVGVAIRSIAIAAWAALTFLVLRWDRVHRSRVRHPLSGR